jgi:hypothetical protein
MQSQSPFRIYDFDQEQNNQLFALLEPTMPCFAQDNRRTFNGY